MQSEECRVMHAPVSNGLPVLVCLKKENAISTKNSIMQMRSKFTVEYLKTRGAQNSADNGIDFLGSLLVRISCQMNFAHLNRSLHAPPDHAGHKKSNAFRQMLQANNLLKNKTFEAFLKVLFMTNLVPSLKIFYNFPFKSYKSLNQRGPKKQQIEYSDSRIKYQKGFDAAG